MPEPADTVTVDRRSLGALGWFYENSTDAFLAVEGETVRTSNPVWSALTGHGASETVGAPFWRFISPEDRDGLEGRLAALPALGQIETELRLIDKAGEPLWSRVKFVRGQLGWLLALIRDIRAERGMRESEARFRGLVSATTNVVFRMSPDWREALQVDGRGFVVDADAPTTSWMEAYLLPADLPRVQQAIAEALAAEGLFQAEVQVRRVDGSTGWALTRAVPIRDEAGRIVEWFGAATDITERRGAEEQQRLLVDELNHRVKNTLATIDAAVDQAFRHARTQDEALASLKARISALTHATDLITGDAPAGRTLRGLLETAILAQAADAARYSLTGPDLELPPRVAHALTLTIHELTTNAVRHGALSTDGGRVDVAWTVAPAHGGRHLRLEWRESGGPPVTPPTRRGIGLRLIERGASAEPGGAVEFRFEPAGLVCAIDAPVA